MKITVICLSPSLYDSLTPFDPYSFCHCLHCHRLSLRLLFRKAAAAADSTFPSH